MPDTQGVALSATEGTTFIPFKSRKPKSGPDEDPNLKNENLEDVKGMFEWNTFQRTITDGIAKEMASTIEPLVEFVEQDLPTQDANFGINEIPTALVVGRDRALLSAVLHDVTETITEDSLATVVRLEEGDCNNSTSALRAIIGGFMTQFEQIESEAAAKRKTSTTLAPFDMARLVTGYEDYYRSQEKHTNLLVVIEQLDNFATEVIQDIIYACSKHLDSLPILFIVTVSDDMYIQQAFTTATRAMLDVTTFHSPSGPSLCFSALEQAWKHNTKRLNPLMLGETSIKVLKDIIDRTDGRIDGLLTALHASPIQLIQMEHVRYQKPVLDAARKYNSGIRSTLYAMSTEALRAFSWDTDMPIKPDNILTAFLTLSERKQPLADGFSPTDVKHLTGQGFVSATGGFGLKSIIDRLNAARYGLTILLELTHALHNVGAYRQEIPLPYLDLLELQAKEGREVGKYLTWMLKKGFESASSADLVTVAQTVLDRFDDVVHHPSDSPRNIIDTLKELELTEKELDQQAKAAYADRLIQGIRSLMTPREALDEIYITESTDGLKELIDPTPRSVVLSGLIRPGGYFRCDCCDPENAQAPEAMAQIPDTCALFQRSLEAGKLLNIADWFNAFTSIMHNENIKRATREPEPARVRRSASRGRRATSSAHVESDADAEGEVDEALEVQREHQARFLLSAHELEFLGLIQATGRRKEHVLRTVFETGD